MILKIIILFSRKYHLTDNTFHFSVLQCQRVLIVDCKVSQFKVQTHSMFTSLPEMWKSKHRWRHFFFLWRSMAGSEMSTQCLRKKTEDPVVDLSNKADAFFKTTDHMSDFIWGFTHSYNTRLCTLVNSASSTFCWQKPPKFLCRLVSPLPRAHCSEDAMPAASISDCNFWWATGRKVPLSISFTVTILIFFLAKSFYKLHASSTKYQLKV